MLVIGLTGGIGSGKSTVAELFSAKGITIIDTDQLARHITLPDQPAFKKIVAKWGQSILLPDHTLDRAQLRKIIFANPAKRRWLEQLLHPLIRSAMEHLIKVAKPPYCIAVVPLLLETKPNPLIKRILVVDITEEKQTARTQTRDKASIQDIQAILATQVSRAQRLAAADDIIYNNNTLEELIPQVDRLHQFYLSIPN
jgi:dephospho-CoA kinase